MQKNLESRIVALEQQGTTAYRWVWRNAGETDAEARTRAGIAPNDNIIIFSWKEQHEND
jgi:DNA/RNA-binding domain of Phe-tRNA-synthetase-like protein